MQVIYGFLELKTHAKISLVARRESGAIRTYVHYGTGNYHPITARIYTDISYFSCDPVLARDATRLFNYMTGYATPKEMEKIAFAPLTLRQHLLTLIDGWGGRTERAYEAADQFAAMLDDIAERRGDAAWVESVHRAAEERWAVIDAVRGSGS